MSTVDEIKSSLDSLHQISEHLEGATVYLDAGCTESFRFLGAIPLLLEHGVQAICSLEHMSPLEMVADSNGRSDIANKVVVMTSCRLSDTHHYTLRCLSAHPGLHYCYIFTSITEMAHSAYPDSPLGPDAFHEYEALLIQDYEELANKHKKKGEESNARKFSENLASEDEGWAQLEDRDISDTLTIPTSGVVYGDSPKGRDQKLVVSVQHFPMILCPLSPKISVSPSGGSVAQGALSTEHEDSLSRGLPPLTTGAHFDSDDVIPGATRTAHFVNPLASKHKSDSTEVDTAHELGNVMRDTLQVKEDDLGLGSNLPSDDDACSSVDDEDLETGDYDINLDGPNKATSNKPLHKCCTFPTKEFELECNTSLTCSSSLPSAPKLVPALKGSREKEGLTPRKLSVSWAPDVYDPPPSSLTYNPKKKTLTKQEIKTNKKHGKGKQKGKNARGGGSGPKDKKHYLKVGGKSEGCLDSFADTDRVKRSSSNAFKSSAELLDYDDDYGDDYDDYGY